MAAISTGSFCRADARHSSSWRLQGVCGWGGGVRERGIRKRGSGDLHGKEVIGEQGRGGGGVLTFASNTICSPPPLSPKEIVVVQPHERLPPRLRQLFEGRCGGQGEPIEGKGGQQVGLQCVGSHRSRAKQGSTQVHTPSHPTGSCPSTLALPPVLPLLLLLPPSSFYPQASFPPPPSFPHLRVEAVRVRLLLEQHHVVPPPTPPPLTWGKSCPGPSPP